ncbi:MAG: killer suppression protein [Cyanobacteria bacterium 13_1_20CM_4_61_6]|nr:MAG: killer suppression protein [Cyanobacteria bacterium 13_1_20CM_4_61_6]
MDLIFETEGKAEEYNNSKLLVKLHNVQRVKLIRRRLDDLRAAPNLEAMRNLPGRCHELKGDRDFEISLDLDGPYRLILYPAHNPIPLKPDLGLDWKKVTAVLVKEVVDTHD